MADIGMGKLVTHNDRHKDAVHVAVWTVTANEKLFAGQHVGFDGDVDHVRATIVTDFAGIVDPFLNVPVFPGQRFWLYLYPNSTTPMRHDWRHPAFEVKDDIKNSAERWMREFADTVNLTYADVISAGREYNRRGDYFVQQMSEAARDEMSSPHTRADFWRNWSILTGEVVKDPDGGVFSCSC